MEVQLYGDTVKTILPQNSIDAATIRPIPDTQEVYVVESPKGGPYDKWIIFDLLEYVPRDNLSEAVQYHLLDLVGEDSVEVTHVKSIPLKANAGLVGDVNYIVHNGTTILASLIRYKKYETDILITINLHQQPDEPLQESIDLLESITLNCDIYDPRTLFGQEP